MSKELGYLAVVLLAGVLLCNSKPTDQEVRAKVVQDGWLPVDVKRTDIVVARIYEIQGFTGAEATYVAVAGQVICLDPASR